MRPSSEPESFAELAALLEQQQAAAMCELAREAAPLAGGWMTFGGVGSYVNKACGLGETNAPELDALVAFFTTRGVEPKVELSAFASPALLEGLAERAFVLKELENVLWCPLGGSRTRLQPPRGWPEGVVVSRVDPADEAAVREFVAISASGFLPEGEPLPETFVEVGLRSARLPGYDSFVARFGDEVVGAGGCNSTGGVTALFGTSVLPAHRRRGIQQALILARMERGLERGSRLACITSRPGIPTERNAARLGFAMGYARVVMVRHGEGLAPSP